MSILVVQHLNNDPEQEHRPGHVNHSRSLSGGVLFIAKLLHTNTGNHVKKMP